jgi:hypothetical protein
VTPITHEASPPFPVSPYRSEHAPVTTKNRLSAGALLTLSNICLIAGFASILAAILVWFLAKEPDLAHGERFGIFVGLWAPTFFILSDRVDRYVSTRRSA